MDLNQGFEILSLKNKITLQTIGKEDIELLRKWKNENKDYFFYNKEISPSEQLEWFDSYLERKEDYIFIIDYKGIKIGCIGFRLVNNQIDVYNVIQGDKRFSRQGLMSLALKLMCSYIIDNYNLNITLKVLTKNKIARAWYEKNGFSEKENKKNYVFMELFLNNFDYTEYKLGHSS